MKSWGKSKTKIILLTAMIFFLVGCPPAPSGYEKYNFDEDIPVQAATLGPGDEFEVRVYQDQKLSGIYKVSSIGEIDFPLIGTIKVDGLTAPEVGAEITRRLSDGFIVNPYVVVYVKEYQSKRIYVVGQVKNPGTIPFKSNMNIIEAIAQAGGFTEMARKDYTVVTRLQEGVQVRIPVNVSKIMDGRAKNFKLKPGDIVFIPESIL